MKAIVGLGNPGEKYEKTRHNIGFRAIKVINNHFGFGKPKNKLNSLISRGEINNEKILLIQPLSFMNKSGQVVHKILDSYYLGENNFIII
ncbi:MAG: aminoacyl-tRNA hydrolase, partial [Halanaerobiales bacterium]